MTLGDMVGNIFGTKSDDAPETDEEPQDESDDDEE